MWGSLVSAVVLAQFAPGSGVKLASPSVNWIKGGEVVRSGIKLSVDVSAKSIRPGQKLWVRLKLQNVSQKSLPMPVFASDGALSSNATLSLIRKSNPVWFYGHRTIPDNQTIANQTVEQNRFYVLEKGQSKTLLVDSIDGMLILKPGTSIYEISARSTATKRALPSGSYQLNCRYEFTGRSPSEEYRPGQTIWKGMAKDMNAKAPKGQWKVVIPITVR